MDIGGVYFIRPWWLVAFVLIPWFVWVLLRGSGDQGGWSNVVTDALKPYVLVGDAASNRQRGLLIFLALTLALLVIALAGPSWRQQLTSLNRGGDPLVVALDLSRSMNVADLSPSRLARAKIKLLELLERRAGRETALVVYSGNAFTAVPLTDDGDTIAALVNSLSTDIMPSRGSYPAAAIDKSKALLLQAGHSSGGVLLITDGGYSPAAGEEARRLVSDGFVLSVLGVGTADGGPVPAPDGGFETDAAGRVAVVSLEERDLKRLAAAGGGLYVRLRVDDRDIERLLDATASAFGTVATEQSVEYRADGGIWFVLALVPLAALAFRRGWVFVIVGAMSITLTGTAEAFEYADLWTTQEARAHRALEEGEYESAAELTDNSERLAAALYRNGNFDASARTLDNAATAREFYNRGNALARGGKFAEAIAAYDAALDLEPGHDDATFNRDLVAEAKRAQEEQAQGDQSSQNGGGGGESSSDSQGGSSQQSDGEQQDRNDSQDQANNANGDGQSNDEDAEPRDPTEAEQRALDELRKAMQEEQRAAQADDSQSGEPTSAQRMAMTPAERTQQEIEQAMEQWLRRIEDDPGGLLRRKFQRQYRLQGRDQDGRSLWPDNEDEPW
ncbi:MAG: VWA domain-containing protein [Pseudomonadota bacterium]